MGLLPQFQWWDLEGGGILSTTSVTLLTGARQSVFVSISKFMTAYFLLIEFQGTSLSQKMSLERHHRALAGCCKSNLKANPPISPTATGVPCPHTPRCINCGKDHTSNDKKCIFWCNRWDGEWIKAHYSKVCALRSFGANISNLSQGKEAAIWLCLYNLILRTYAFYLGTFTIIIHYLAIC